MGYEPLRRISALHTSLWLAIGDFNEILSQHERFGGALRPRQLPYSKMLSLIVNYPIWEFLVVNTLGQTIDTMVLLLKKTWIEL